MGILDAQGGGISMLKKTLIYQTLKHQKAMRIKY